MELSVEKVLALTLLTALSIILGVIPYFIIRYASSSLNQNSPRYQLLLTTLSCFGAGVLLSTAWIHVLPEVREGAANSSELQTTVENSLPVAEILVLAGFCMIYLMEEVAHFIMLDSGHHHPPNTIARHNSIAHGIPMPHASGTRVTLVVITNSGESDIGKPNLNAGIASSESVSAQDNGKREECPDDKLILNSPIRSTLALIALSFHSICEGLVIGVETSVDMWVVFGGIASHKFIVAFCMGMEMMSTKASTWVYMGSIVFFSVTSPIGVIIGSFIGSGAHETPSTTAVVINGLVCGTLLYVVFFEVLNREKERRAYSMPNSRAVGFIQFTSLVIGIVAMGWMSIKAHSHSRRESEKAHVEDNTDREYLF